MLANRFARSLAITLVTSFAAISPQSASAADPKATIKALEDRLASIGAPRIEGTSTVAGKELPAIYFGTRRMNGQYEVVDEIRKKHQATATIFVRDGEEFFRVSTNVLTPEGKRGVGTTLARNAAYIAVAKGTEYCGPIDVLGVAFDACYRPIKDAKGMVIGATYIGHKKS